MCQQDQKDVCQLGFSRADQKVSLLYQSAEVPPSLHHSQDQREDHHQEVQQDPKIHKKVLAREEATEDQRKSREVCFHN